MSRDGYSQWFRPPGSSPGGGGSAWVYAWDDSSFGPQTIPLLAGQIVGLLGHINGYNANIQVLVDGSPVGPEWDSTDPLYVFGAMFVAPADGDYEFDLNGFGAIDEPGVWVITAASGGGTPVGMTFPGADASGDGNGNDVSGPLNLTAGQQVAVSVNVTSSDYTGGFFGIYSPSLNSYGTGTYSTLGATSGSGSFTVDADAADWYVFVQAPALSYDGALDGTGIYVAG